ncbi:hypothetical protein DFH06DRAFT_698661 [Mycena polygramma]|nr:hypothetical protein DFH06DRAFT_698661 [Mycena polygramma]
MVPESFEATTGVLHGGAIQRAARAGKSMRRDGNRAGRRHSPPPDPVSLIFKVAPEVGSCNNMATSLIPQFRLPYRCFTVLGSAAESARRLVFMILSAHDHSLDAYPTIHLAQGSNNVVGASPAKQFLLKFRLGAVAYSVLLEPISEGHRALITVQRWSLGRCDLRAAFVQRGMEHIWHMSYSSTDKMRASAIHRSVQLFASRDSHRTAHSRFFPRVVVAASPRHALTDYKAVGKTIRIETDDVTPVKDHHSIDFYITEYVAMRSRPSLFITL